MRLQCAKCDVRSAMYLLGLSLVVILSGCVVRTYPLTRDRVDQDLTSGNRGFIRGGAPQAAERKATRTTQVVEIELRSPIKFEKAPLKTAPQKTIAPTAQEESLAGNRGYITGSAPLAVPEPQGALERYTVQKNDTLQKISQKFYGTTKRWTKIYDANKDVLKGPNKIYPGQVINIPVESLKEPQENLK